MAKPTKGGLSLYANLLDPSTQGDAHANTISGAPVSYQQTAETNSKNAGSDRQQINAASLRFQPTKRPQIQSQKAKIKPPVQKSAVPVSIESTVSVSLAETSGLNSRPQAPRTTLADWTGDADDDEINGRYAGEKRQRGGRKKRKKDKEPAVVAQNWDDIYDPSRPNNYEDYKNSNEKIAEIREWHDRLNAHRALRPRSVYSDSDSDDRERPPVRGAFAPPSSFAPPPVYDDETTPPPPPPPPAPDHLEPTAAQIPDDATGEAAFERRRLLSQTSSYQQQHPTPPPPPPPPHQPPTIQDSKPVGTVGISSTISRAPVRYNLPSAPADIPATEAELQSAFESETVPAESEGPAQADDAPRSLRPGQKGFAERLMSKYGWSKGSGLGAAGSGILNPLRVQVEKQKKRPDSEGGGFVGPGGMGKIIGGKRKGGDASESKFGTMSEVVVLKGMVDGMDLDAEMGAGNGGLMQEIGDECGEKYGRVERVYISRDPQGQASVFVKFTSALSGLRAVNALEGRLFNGNTISAKFFDSDRFDRGEYA